MIALRMLSQPTCRWILLAVVCCFATPSFGDDTRPTVEQLEFFEKQVRPLLVEHCYACHSGESKKLKASLRVDSRAALLSGGDSGAAIVPHDLDASLLIAAVRYESYEMPPKGKLSSDNIDLLERWISMGAPWPEEAAPTSTVTAGDFDLAKRKSEHWVWQPISSPPVPPVVDQSWPRESLDHFVLARLEQDKLHHADDVDAAALLRRLYFDLVGLPPTAEQAAQFLDDTSPSGMERLVDDLLASPQFGERWGRHWLDLVRYAESHGHEFDDDIPNAFQYRDYVIRAFNADVPYDQFVREHLAGDLLANPRLNPDSGFNESILGTGFWFLGEWVHSPVDIRKEETDRFDNMIDVMSKTFLGVTVSCARCHDHKFDAISTADYYSLCGFLQSSDYRQVPFESLEHNGRIAEELAELDHRYSEIILANLAGLGLQPPTMEPLDDEAAVVVLFDYANMTSDQFMQDGFIFGHEPRRAGDPVLAFVDGQWALDFARSTAAASDSFWDGLQSLPWQKVQNKDVLITLPRSGRTLRTPTFTLTNGDVRCRVRGIGHVVACVDSHRLVAGPLHGETVVPINTSDGWVALKLQRYVGHQIHLEFTPANESQLEVSLVTQGATPEILERIAARDAVVAAAVAKFAGAALSSIDKLRGEIDRSWSVERAGLRSKIMHRSHLAIAMMDGTGEDDRVLIRGNSAKPGDVEPRHFLTAITGSQPMQIKSGSGRLELANQINDPANPLAARVIVNRIWHTLLGRGIVTTADDFGVLGQRPTHPELLDHLATRFAQDGRSIKQMIRSIVLSRTYQMSSHANPAALAADPKNLLWHYRPPKRLQGEAIRDALLSLSGELERTFYGEPVPIHLTPFMDGRGRPNQSGPIDGDRRRSIYIAVRRNFVSPFMLTFDTPSPFSAMGRRNVSNVPAQALIMMNDPFVVEQSMHWANSVRGAAAIAADRIAAMYQAAFCRRPTAEETYSALQFLHAESAARGVSEDDASLWIDLAHALVNTKEFIFLR